VSGTDYCGNPAVPEVCHTVVRWTVIMSYSSFSALPYNSCIYISPTSVFVLYESDKRFVCVKWTM